ncbi:MAG: FtsX-like permease family protein [Spirochaetales bacterium]
MTFREIAIRNVRRRAGDYTAFLLAAAFSAMVFFVFVSLYYHPQFRELSTASSRLTGLFMFSAVLVGLFTVLFVWYSGALFFSRRQREVGTYLLLGMRHRDIGRILYTESLLIGAIATLLGMSAGLLLRRLFLLLLVRMVGLPIELEIQVTPLPFLVTGGAFVLLFAIGGLAPIIRVYRVDLVALFASQKKRDEEPKHAPARLMLGMLFIGAGYYGALRPLLESVHISTMLQILGVTILGTFLAFGAGSYLMLRAIKRRVATRHNPERLAALGQLLFRIRKNAKFLALVAVLNAVAITSVGTFITLRTERSLMLDSVAQSQHYDFSFLVDSEEQFDEIVALAVEAEPDQLREAVVIDALVLDERVTYGTVGGIRSFVTDSVYDKLQEVRGLPEQEPLSPGEVRLVAQTGAAPAVVLDRDLVLNGEPLGLTITQYVPMYMFSWGRFPAYTAVITDADYARLRDRFDAPSESAAIEQLGIINVAEPEQALDLFLILQQALPEESEIGGFVPSLAIVNALTGVLLFTGGFIGIMLILSNGSVIFFRQLMEATESVHRFRLLTQLGFSEAAVRRTILRGQITVFGWPYLVGFVHSLVALVFLSRLIEISTIGAHLAISGIYAVVYAAYLLVNARTYERIVLAKVFGKRSRRRGRSVLRRERAHTPVLVE